MTRTDYQPREFNLKGLEGISDETLEIHLELYKGYVENTNKLNGRLSEIVADSEISDDEMLVFSELKRRLGFEYNGMVLHEYYFENLTSSAGDRPAPSFADALAQSTFREYERWKADFVAVGMMRGVGWAVCYEDQTSGAIANLWVDEHQTNNIAGHRPLLVMDVWEHAWFRDYKPSEKGKYIEAFLANVDWNVVAQRLGTTAK